MNVNKMQSSGQSQAIKNATKGSQSRDKSPAKTQLPESSEVKPKVIQTKTIPVPPPRPVFVPPYVPTERTSTASFKAPMSDEKRKKLEEAKVEPSTFSNAINYFTSPVKFITSMFAPEAPKKPAKKVYKTSYSPPFRENSALVPEPIPQSKEPKLALEHAKEPEEPQPELNTQPVHPLNEEEVSSLPKPLMHKQTNLRLKAENRINFPGPKSPRNSKDIKQKLSPSTHRSDVTISNQSRVSYRVKSKTAPEEKETKPSPKVKKDPRKMYQKVSKKVPRPKSKSPEIETSQFEEIIRKRPPAYVIRSHKQKEEIPVPVSNEEACGFTTDHTEDFDNSTQMPSAIGSRMPNTITSEQPTQVSFDQSFNGMLNDNVMEKPGSQTFFGPSATGRQLITPSQLVEEALSNRQNCSLTPAHPFLVMSQTPAVMTEKLEHVIYEGSLDRSLATMSLTSQYSKELTGFREHTPELPRRQLHSPEMSWKQIKIDQRGSSKKEPQKFKYDWKTSEDNKAQSKTNKKKANLNKSSTNLQAKKKNIVPGLTPAGEIIHKQKQENGINSSERKKNKSRSSSTPSSYFGVKDDKRKKQNQTLEVSKEWLSKNISNSNKDKIISSTNIDLPSVAKRTPTSFVAVNRDTIVSSSNKAMADKSNAHASLFSPPAYYVSQNNGKHSNEDNLTKISATDPQKSKPVKDAEKETNGNEKKSHLGSLDSGKNVIFWPSTDKKNSLNDGVVPAQRERTLSATETAEAVAKTAATAVLAIATRTVNRIRERREEEQRKKMLKAADGPSDPLPPQPADQSTPKEASPSQKSQLLSPLYFFSPKRQSSPPQEKLSPPQTNQSPQQTTLTKSSQTQKMSSSPQADPSHLPNVLASQDRSNLSSLLSKSRGPQLRPKYHKPLKTIKTNSFFGPKSPSSHAEISTTRSDKIKNDPALQVAAAIGAGSAVGSAAGATLETEDNQNLQPIEKKVEDRDNSWEDYYSLNPMLHVAASTMMGEMP